MKFLTCHMPMLGLLATGNSVMIGSSLQTVAVLLSIKYVSGAGYTVNPPSRAYMCRKKGQNSSPGCKNAVRAIWEPQSVGKSNIAGEPMKKVPKNICGAGIQAFKGLSHFPASDFEATPIKPVNGKFRFKFRCIACKRTESFQAYVTKQGWNGEKEELTWDHMDKFCHINYGRQNPKEYQDLECPFPKTGNKRDIILILWEPARRDSSEMWFNCSDVIIKGDASTKAPSTKAPFLAATTKALKFDELEGKVEELEGKVGKLEGKVEKLEGGSGGAK